MAAEQGGLVGGSERLGEFRLIAILGHGGSGTVYAATSPRHPEVALKVLRQDLAGSERQRRRFFDEVERMRRVRHPSLVALVDAGVLPDGRPYLCMPLVRGETVAARVRRERLPVDVGLRHFSGLAAAVSTLHRAGLVHRDIKPENVLLDETDGRAVLLDFGIAREIDGPATTTTRVGRIRGTPAYMAPERFFGAPASVATDIYELGVVLYVMLVGRLPWADDVPDARLHPRAPHDLGVDLPAPLVTVMMRALSTRPEARPRSADALAADALRGFGAVAWSRCRTAGFCDAEAMLHDAPEQEHPTGPDRPPAAWTRVAGALVAERYRLDRLVGTGGMGEVWAATHTLTKKRVALKFLRPSLAGSDRHRRRLLREARTASQVRHANVVQIYDVLELAGGGPMIVMDLLEGESLRDRLTRQPVLTTAEVACVMLPVISAIAAAHRQGVVHRDLKPENIFLAQGDGRTRVTVLDFGIAKLTAAGFLATGTCSLTADGAMLGTPFYMSPEQIYGEPDVDHRSDIWAIGVILYECLTGCRPTQGIGIGQILKIITRREIVPLNKAAPHLPARLAAVVTSCLAPARSARPSSLAQVDRELRACWANDQASLPFDLPPPVDELERRKQDFGSSRDLPDSAARIGALRRRSFDVLSRAAAASLLVGCIALAWLLSAPGSSGNRVAQPGAPIPVASSAPVTTAPGHTAELAMPTASAMSASSPKPAASSRARTTRMAAPRPSPSVSLDSWLDQR
jgi:eukaryotic-like serine/threonine-protein kinase